MTCQNLREGREQEAQTELESRHQSRDVSKQFCLSNSKTQSGEGEADLLPTGFTLHVLALLSLMWRILSSFLHHFFVLYLVQTAF